MEGRILGSTSATKRQYKGLASPAPSTSWMARVGQGVYNSSPGSAGPPSYAPPAASGGGSTGGGSPNYPDGPGVLGARSAYNSGVTSLDAWLRAGRASQFVNFGDPSMVLPGFDVDPNTMEMARQNYKSGNSILSRLDLGHANAARGIVNNLAARGLIRSGDLGYREGQENQQYGNNVYDAKRSLLDSLNGYQQQYLDRKNSLQGAVTQALQQQYQDRISNLNSGGLGY